MQRYLLFTLFALLITYIMVSCEKDNFTNNPDIKLDFSVDTISFDTIFTTIGSTTKRFTVRNQSNSGVEISSIYLNDANNSPFRLNINGSKGDRIDNILIPGKDSIFVFAEVTVDPTGDNLPMLIHDSIIFNWNGNSEVVNLIAYGQDVHLLNGDSLTSQKWINDKPYLIYNSVLVESNETLEIEAGCRIHFHKGSSLFVEGTLQVNGTTDYPIYFQGDRLEEEYSDLPDQWGYYYENEEEDYIIYYGGIHFFSGSKNNTINNAVIRNAIKGIQVDSLSTTSEPVLTLKNSVIENMTLNCLDARTTSIKASNCVFTNSGYCSVRLLLGGNYEFTHCTMANYYDGNVRSEPILYLNNYYSYENVVYAYDFEARFNNCIVYGDNDSEVLAYYVNSEDFNVEFNSCLLKLRMNSSGLSEDCFEDCIFNSDPIFEDIYVNNLAIDSLSPARNNADVEISQLYPFDLRGNSRLDDEEPDIGALEWGVNKK